MGWGLVVVLCVVLGTLFPEALLSQDETSPKNEVEQLRADQSKLANQYQLLEEKLFSLYQYERDNNPMRSKLLESAYVLSKEQMTTADLKQVVEWIKNAKYKDAESGQLQVIGELETLLKLLESEDRNKRVRDEIRRHQEYLKEVERLLRIQKSIRAQTEGKTESGRLANAESRAANRAARLARQISKNEGNGEGSKSGSQGSGGDSKKQDKKSEKGSKGKQGEGKQGEGKRERVSREKVSREKVSREKVSREKVSREKVSREKVSREKVR